MVIDARLRKLESYMDEYVRGQNPTTFLLEDETIFTTMQGPLDYLIEHGTQTPRGKIVSYPYSAEDADGLSLAIFQTINDEIQDGTLRRLVDELEGNT